MKSIHVRHLCDTLYRAKHGAHDHELKMAITHGHRPSRPQKERMVVALQCHDHLHDDPIDIYITFSEFEFECHDQIPKQAQLIKLKDGENGDKVDFCTTECILDCACGDQ